MQKKKEHLLMEDLPSALMEVMRMYWIVEEVPRSMRIKPEEEQVQAFICWCKEPGNLNEKYLTEEEVRFLEEN